MRETWEAILNGYSGVYFSSKKIAGLLFLAATLTRPVEGLEALFCLLSAVAFARALGFDRALIRLGVYSVNALLVGLALAHQFPPSGRLILLLALAGFTTVLAVSGLRSLFEGIFSLPQFSLAFVLITIILTASLRSTGAAPHDFVVGSALVHFPSPIQEYMSAVATVFFRSDALAGLLVFAGLLYSSRIAAVLSVIGFASGFYFYRFSGVWPTTGLDFAGYNFIVCAIAVGGVYCVPSLASYGAAALSAALCAPAAHWAAAALRPFGTDILSLPFLGVSYLFIAGLRVRAVNARPELVLLPAGSPEENLAIAQSRRLRQKSASSGLRLPFLGAWQVTQGVDGEHTHKDQWRHALDFSLPEAYGLPVTAAQAGRIARVVDGIADNDPGHMNTERNWGNYVSIRHEDGSHSLLAHLKKGSIRVRPGDQIGAGEVIALCGNSGRSPTPHLHYQLQKSAEPGGETLPFAFSSYIKLNGSPILAERTLPEKGEIVENLVSSPMMRTAFGFLTGDAQAFEVETWRGRRDETLFAAIDLYGWRYLESNRSRARLYYHVTPDMFYLDYCSAKPGSLLFALFLAASKVPLVETRGLAWKDELPLNGFFRGLTRLCADLAMPFAPGYAVQARRRFFDPRERSEPRVAGIETEISARFPGLLKPIQARAVFAEARGPLEIAVTSAARGLNVRAVRL